MRRRGESPRAAGSGASKRPPARSRCCREWGIEAAACAEPVDFSAEGVRRSACIDPERLCALFPGDPEFAALKRDGGQRRFCGCALSKDIGFYHSCRHGCLYCYA